MIHQMQIWISKSYVKKKFLVKWHALKHSNKRRRKRFHGYQLDTTYEITPIPYPVKNLPKSRMKESCST